METSSVLKTGLTLAQFFNFLRHRNHSWVQDPKMYCTAILSLGVSPKLYISVSFEDILPSFYRFLFPWFLFPGSLKEFLLLSSFLGIPPFAHSFASPGDSFEKQKNFHRTAVLSLPRRPTDGSYNKGSTNTGCRAPWVTN